MATHCHAGRELTRSEPAACDRITLTHVIVSYESCFSMSRADCEGLCSGGHNGDDASPRGNHQHEETDCGLVFPCRFFLTSLIAY